MGRPFSAILKLAEPDWKLEFDFGQSDGDGDGDEPIDFSDQVPVGDCPRCASRVFEHGMSYVCEKSVGPGRSCEFRSGKVILQQPVERAQMAKLLAEGRTDLLDGFVSSRTRRRFKAFLVRQPDGKVGFEFQAAAPRPGAKGATDTAATAGGPSAARAGAFRGAAAGTRPGVAPASKAVSAQAPMNNAPAKKPAAATKPAATKPAAKKSAAKKSAATKPATTTPAAKKPAAKKPAARKPAAKTGAASKATATGAARKAPASRGAAATKALGSRTRTTKGG
jgi:DNA topoisomerase-3